MKKIFLILFASLFAFTQCGKDPETNNDDTKMVSISGKIDTDNGKSDIAIPGGNISWKGEESIFIAVPAHGDFPARLVEMRNTASGGNAFQGEAPKGLIESGKNYEIWYFGNNGEGVNNVTNIYNIYNGERVLQGKTISFEEQTGLLENIGDFHIAKGTVSFVQNNNTGNLTFSRPVSFETQMAIAYMSLYYKYMWEPNDSNWDNIETETLYLDINSNEDYNTLTFGYNAFTNKFEQKYSNVNVTTHGISISQGSEGQADISITRGIKANNQPYAFLGHNYIALLPHSDPHFYFECMMPAICPYIFDYQFGKDIIKNQIYTGGYDNNNDLIPIFVNGDQSWTYDESGSSPWL